MGHNYLLKLEYWSDGVLEYWDKENFTKRFTDVLKRPF